MPRDYSSFPRALAKHLKPSISALGYDRVTDSIYAQKADGFWRVVFFELSRADGIDFYVTYGVTIPDLGAPWFTPAQLKHSGLLISERLYHQNGQGFACETTAELAESARLVSVLLQSDITAWHSRFFSLAAIGDEYARRWSLAPLGANERRNRQGVLNYALLLYAAEEKSASQAWLQEAATLMDGDIDGDDLLRIEAMLRSTVTA